MSLIRKKAKPPKKNYRGHSIAGNTITRKKRIKKIFLVTIFIVFILIFITGQRGSYQLYKFSKQANELEIEIAKITEEIRRLEQERDKINNDPTYIEKIAREKYKMKKEGEQVYQIVDE